TPASRLTTLPTLRGDHQTIPSSISVVRQRHKSQQVARFHPELACKAGAPLATTATAVVVPTDWLRQSEKLIGSRRKPDFLVLPRQNLIDCPAERPSTR